jgi:hypothetical protein
MSTMTFDLKVWVVMTSVELLIDEGSVLWPNAGSRRAKTTLLAQLRSRLQLKLASVAWTEGSNRVRTIAHAAGTHRKPKCDFIPDRVFRQCKVYSSRIHCTWSSTFSELIRHSDSLNGRRLRRSILIFAPLLEETISQNLSLSYRLLALGEGFSQLYKSIESTKTIGRGLCWLQVRRRYAVSSQVPSSVAVLLLPCHLRP